MFVNVVLNICELCVQLSVTVLVFSYKFKLAFYRLSLLIIFALSIQNLPPVCCLLLNFSFHYREALMYGNSQSLHLWVLFIFPKKGSFDYFICISFNHLFSTELSSAFHGPDIFLDSKDMKFPSYWPLYSAEGRDSKQIHNWYVR